MSALLYVIVPLVIFTIVGLLVSLKDRKPRSIESGVEEFSRQRSAMNTSTSNVQAIQRGRSTE